MVFFINDKKIRLTDKIEVLAKKFDMVYKNIAKAEASYLEGKVLIVSDSNQIINKFVNLIEGKEIPRLKSVTFLVKDASLTFKAVKRTFKIVQAGGGIVEKDDQILLIHRQGKWDIPKGKQDKGETVSKCALREVEEETGVKVKMKRKLKDSYHTYIRNSKRNLKHTHWYIMKCVDDSKMCAQAEEKIDEVRWCTLTEAKILMADSYYSLQHLLKKYEKTKRLMGKVNSL